MKRRAWLRGCLLVALSPLLGTQSVLAQDYPTRPVKLVNPFAPGGTIDVVARVMADKMGKYLGQSVVIEYKPGAAGTVAAGVVAKGPKDGYTIYFGTSATLGFSKLLNKDLPYDPIADFTPVATVGSVPVGVFVDAGLGINTLQELIAAAKAKPGSIAFGSTGVGGVSHLAGEMLKARAGIDMLHVPYAGAAARYWSDITGGRIQVVFAGVTGGLPLAKEGRVKLLATATRQRSKLLPDVPAVGEVIPGYDAPAWFGLVVAKGTPQPIVAKLEAAALAALAEPSTRPMFESAGVDMDPVLDAQAFAAKMPRDIEMWKGVLAGSGLLKGVEK